MSNTFGGITGLTAEDYATAVWSKIVSSGLSAAEVLDALKIKADDSNVKVSALTGEVASIKATVEASEAKIDIIDTNIDALIVTVDGIEIKIDSIILEAAAIKTDVIRTRKHTTNKAEITEDELGVVIYDDDKTTPYAMITISANKLVRTPA